MKYRFLLLILAVLFALPSFAHGGGDKGNDSNKKEMAEFKLKFLADELDLKEDQKKEFEEVYTQMVSERRAVFKRIKKAEKSISENKNATEADYERANKEINDAKNEMSLIEKKYDEKFATFLSKKQIYKLKEAENKFKDIVRECRDKKLNQKKDKK